MESPRIGETHDPITVTEIIAKRSKRILVWGHQSEFSREFRILIFMAVYYITPFTTDEDLLVDAIGV
jgi:hypothetical protein